MYCPKCGAELPDGAKFCPKCGTSADFSTVPTKQTRIEAHENSSDVPSANQVNTSMPNEEVRCPKCGASGCTPHYKQNVSGGGYGCLQGGLGALILGPFGLLCGLCGRNTTTTNTLMWVCPKCGHEFMSIKDIFSLSMFLLWIVYFLTAIVAFFITVTIMMGALYSEMLVCIIILLLCGALCLWLALKAPGGYKEASMLQLISEAEKEKLRHQACIGAVIILAGFLLPFIIAV